MPENLVNRDEALRRLGNPHPGTLHRPVKTGELPAPVRLGRQNSWRSSDIDALIERKASEAKVRTLSPKNYDAQRERFRRERAAKAAAQEEAGQ